MCSRKVPAADWAVVVMAAVEARAGADLEVEEARGAAARAAVERAAVVREAAVRVAAAKGGAEGRG